MDYYSAKELFDSMNPDKIVTYDFDNFCIKSLNFDFTNGLPNENSFCEFSKVRVTVEDGVPFYVPISSHREINTLEFHKNLLG